MRRKTLFAIPALKRLGYFHVVPAGTYRNAAAASTSAVNGPRKPVKILSKRAIDAEAPIALVKGSVVLTLMRQPMEADN